jgi:AcrR family transcriptional regulator
VNVLRGRSGPVRADSLNVVRGQATRRRILDAARRRILAQGFEAMRLDEVAVDAGVTKGAVIKSVGGKSSILLALNEEDRSSRVAIIDEARKYRSALRRRLTDTVRRVLELDATRLNLIVAFAGYSWFWDGEERARAEQMVDDTRARLCALIVDAADSDLSAERLELVSRRLVAAYGIGVRDLCHGRAAFDQVVRFVVDFALD